MKQYNIQFEFEGSHYVADVAEIDGLDHTQFAISARDAALATRFRTNIIRRDKDDGRWNYDIPAASGGDVYMASLLSGLQKNFPALS